MTGTTSRQFETARYIGGYIADNGFAPSFDEITAAIGLASKSGTHRLIEGLIERGFVEKIPNRARTVDLTKAGWALIGREPPSPSSRPPEDVAELRETINVLRGDLVAERRVTTRLRAEIKQLRDELAQSKEQIRLLRNRALPAAAQVPA